MTILIVVILVVVFVVFVWFSYRLKVDNVFMVTGAPGTGKDTIQVPTAIRYYKSALFKVKIKNKFLRLFKKELQELPLFYSNMPIKWRAKRPLIFLWLYNSKKKEWKDGVGFMTFGVNSLHMLLGQKIVKKSMVYISEWGSFASQWKHSNINIQQNLDEMIRFVRHYTKGGYLFLNDQSSNNVVLQARRRAGTVLNLTNMKTYTLIPYILKFYIITMRRITIGEEDVKAVETQNTENRDNSSKKFGMFRPFFAKQYDTYAFSRRYRTVPELKEHQFVALKTCKLLEIPNHRVIAKTTSED